MRGKLEEFLSERKEIKAYLFCLLTAALFLTFCSRSSFLFSYNNWDDANSYFSMGKFMMNGGVIYRDLYDQKGPYLYLLYGIAYLISNNSFLGVFVLEILAVSIFFYYSYRIIRLYCSFKIALALLPLLAMGTLSSLSFYWGGAAEEFCLPLLAYSLYTSIRYFKEEYPQLPSKKVILINGILAGIILQIKYTMLGFYFIWMAIMALTNLSKEKWKKTFGNCLLFLGAMGATILPWLIYFGIHGALKDWYTCYIYNNIFFYSNLQEESMGLLDRGYQLAKILYNLILDNKSYFGFIVLGLYYMLFSKSNRWLEKINVFALFGFLFLGIYIGGANIFYYSIPLMVFAAIGFGALGRGLMKFEVNQKLYFARGKITYTILGVVIFAASLWGANTLSINTEYRKMEKEEHFLFRFKEIVEQKESPTLLNINMLDAGLYTVADILPTCKYFQTNGIALEELYEEQERYIREGLTDFVIARFDYPDYLLENYELAAEQSFNTSGKEESMYYLFQRKN